MFELLHIYLSTTYIFVFLNDIYIYIYIIYIYRERESGKTVQIHQRPSEDAQHQNP